MAIEKLDVTDFYFHSIIQGAKNAFRVVDGVIGKKGILPPKQINNFHRIGCNALDEVCLSKVTETKYNDSNYLSCFDIYVPRLMSFIIDKKFDIKHRVKKPTLISTDDIFDLSDEENKKCTNLYDEYRTKGRIPFKYIKGLSIPYEDLINNPIIYLTFVDDLAQVQFYNGYFTKQEIDSYLKIHSTNKKMKKRKEFIEEYIYLIESLIQQRDVNLPIYFYEHENDRKLILK